MTRVKLSPATRAKLQPRCLSLALFSSIAVLLFHILCNLLLYLFIVVSSTRTVTECFVLFALDLWPQNWQPLLAHSRCSVHCEMALGLKEHTSPGRSWKPGAIFCCMTVWWAQNKGFALCRRTGGLREGEGGKLVRVLTTVRILKDEWEFSKRIKRW